jgi:methyl-accepting chemotaxis protein
MATFKDNLAKNAELQEREAAAQLERTRRAELITSLTNNFDHEASITVKLVAAAATEMQSTATSMSATAEEGPTGFAFSSRSQASWRASPARSAEPGTGSATSSARLGRRV